MNWHTREEKRIIKRLGGKPLRKQGYDGLIKSKPVEVRSLRKDHRFRIMKTTHKELLRKKGAYIFINNGRIKQVKAKTVNKIIKERNWYKDRGYPHTFVYKKEIFKGRRST